MTELTETCGSGRCDCYIHDYVAKLIGVRSTRKDGYDPHKPVSLGWAAEHAEKTEQIVLKALAKEKADIQHLLPSTARIPIVTGSTVEYVYEFGNPEPVAVYGQPKLPEGFDIIMDIDGSTLMKYQKDNYAVVRRLDDIDSLTISRAISVMQLDMIREENKETEKQMKELKDKIIEFEVPKAKMITDSTGPK